ncbi:nitrogen permease regulator 2 [Myriangium duriaei CBS 260.36]|uniref:Nitrogen permease regulator 2 n=1 Tax=Myriangium duriaei CBS 260.36 TaxID=1168546 RepID=A0A9P4IQZ2_9PEZI|nr:nitrogen permease regulator 2 [Myriangium duriaei CBS 260.36]
MAQDATIRSIFYARFDDDDGPKVLHQVPEGSIIPCPPSQTAMKEPFFDFQAVSSYLIPIREFCNRPLSVCTNGYRILGHPVRITDPDKYERNDFIFNFCIVIDEDAEHGAIKRVVSKLASVFGNLEEQNRFLSRDEESDTIVAAGTEGYGGEKGSKVFAIVEMVFEDLNAVGEAMIPIDKSNTLNLSLFPSRPPPPQIQNHHVPLSVARFTSLQTSAWDLTVQRIIPHVNGINSVSRISALSDVDPSLTRRAIQHLIYYDCILLLDIFSFAAVYAPTPRIKSFIASPTLQSECASYVYSPSSIFTPSPSPSNPVPPSPRSPSNITLIQLYTSLRPSLPLRDFCISHAFQLANIDIRRLITFGVLHGFLYRAHRYALLPTTSSSAPTAAPVLPTTTTTTSKDDDTEAAYRVAALSSGWRLRGSLAGTPTTTTTTPPINGGKEGKQGREEEEGKKDGEKESSGEVKTKESSGRGKAGREVLRFADGMHSLDEACTALKLVEGEVVARMRAAGGDAGVVFVYK